MVSTDLPKEMVMAPSQAETLFPEPDMRLLSDPNYEPPTFPINILPKHVRQWIIQTAEIASAPIDYVAFGLFAHVAGLIGNTLCVSPWPGWEEPAILWVALVGVPSSGKTPSQNAINAAIHEVEAEQQKNYPAQKAAYEEKLSVAKSTLKAWESELSRAIKDNTPRPSKPNEATFPERPVRPEITVLDATIEALAGILKENPRGLIQKRDELSGWLHAMGQYSGKSEGERAQWLQIWTAQPLKVHRVKYAEPLEVDRATLSIIGGIQPDKLTAITCGDNDGLSARFLYIAPNSLPPKRPTRKPDLDCVFVWLKNILEIPLNTSPRCIELEEEGKALIQKYREKLYGTIHNKSDHMSGFLGKQAGYAVRIALVLQVLGFASAEEGYTLDCIQTHVIKNAIKLSQNYLIPMAQQVFSGSHKPRHAVQTDAMVKWLVKHRSKKVNKRSLYRDAKIQGIRSATDAQMVIDELVESGWLIPLPSREGDSTGRNKGDFVVNPRVWQWLEANKTTASVIDETIAHSGNPETPCPKAIVPIGATGTEEN